ncbi:MAG TPA: cytochrome c [Candidatus Limnocylindria bacterium]|nr:cytochrome c [Candidatus Limnocylindria bacterium]
MVEPKERQGEVTLSRDAAVQAALLLLLGAAIFGVFAFVRWYRRDVWRRPAVAAAVMAVGSAAAFLVAFTVAVNVPSYPVPFTARFLSNPVPDTPESVAAGRAVYERNCLVCHGQRGRGDGPAGLALNPRPLDLKLHVPLHAPGEHFHWISEGIPGTAMAGWKTQLSDTERWQLVRYLYALAAQP